MVVFYFQRLKRNVNQVTIISEEAWKLGIIVKYHVTILSNNRFFGDGIFRFACDHV